MSDEDLKSATGEILDYDREPNLKAILVGGNRLSRGLTIEGLLVLMFDYHDTLRGKTSDQVDGALALLKDYLSKVFG